MPVSGLVPVTNRSMSGTPIADGLVLSSPVELATRPSSRGPSTVVPSVRTSMLTGYDQRASRDGPDPCYVGGLRSPDVSPAGDR